MLNLLLAVLLLSWDADHRGATIDNGEIKMHIAANGNVNSVRYADQEMIQPGKNGNVYFNFVSDSIRDVRLDADTAIVLRHTDELIEIVYASSKHPKQCYLPDLRSTADFLAVGRLAEWARET